MWRNYLISAVRLIIMLPITVVDSVGYIVSLLWMMVRLASLLLAKFVVKPIPLSDDCPYARSYKSYIEKIKDAHKAAFVESLDWLI